MVADENIHNKLKELDGILKPEVLHFFG